MIGITGRKRGDYRKKLYEDVLLECFELMEVKPELLMGRRIVYALHKC